MVTSDDRSKFNNFMQDKAPYMYITKYIYSKNFFFLTSYFFYKF